jgi:APA family basic amino acid/polyamine antiporter
MARDGIFFDRVGWLDPRSRAPVVAIALQGIWASVIALSGAYEKILNYVVAIDALFFGLTGASLLVFRWRAKRALASVPRAEAELAIVTAPRFRMPGHPYTTIVFVAAFWILALNTVLQAPSSAGIGVLILLVGVPVYFVWRRPRSG